MWSPNIPGHGSQGVYVTCTQWKWFASKGIANGWFSWGTFSLAISCDTIGTQRVIDNSELTKLAGYASSFQADAPCHWCQWRKVSNSTWHCVPDGDSALYQNSFMSALEIRRIMHPWCTAMPTISPHRSTDMMTTYARIRWRVGRISSWMHDFSSLRVVVSVEAIAYKKASFATSLKVGRLSAKSIQYWGVRDIVIFESRMAEALGKPHVLPCIKATGSSW